MTLPPMTAPVAAACVVAEFGLLWWIAHRKNADVRRIKRRHHE